MASPSHFTPSPASPGRRVRVLVSAEDATGESWLDWRAAHQACTHARQIGLARAPRPAPESPPHAAAVGEEEELRWFAPIDSPSLRRLILDYAETALRAKELPTPKGELASLIWPREFDERRNTAANGIILLSHAETDLLSVARAGSRLGKDFVPFAAHSLIGLTSAHDLRTLVGEYPAQKRVVIARIHGRVADVPGLSELTKVARAEGWSLIAISGVEDADPALASASTCTPVIAAMVTSYFMAGGVENVTEAFRFVAHEFLGSTAGFVPPKPMPAHGLYHPDLLVTTPEEWNDYRSSEQPQAAVVFYRAHVLSGNLEFVDQLVRALAHRGFAAIGLFTSSLRDCDDRGVPLVFSPLLPAPAVIVNTVSFPIMALTSLERAPSGVEEGGFAKLGAPVIQAIACGTPRVTWEASVRGLSPTETTINIALPECDGRTIGVPISFKENHRYVPDGERINRVAGLAARLAMLQRKPNQEKRIAIVLTNSSGKAQKVGNAVGLDTPASLIRTLHAMQGVGYGVSEFPSTSDEFMAALLAQGCYDDKFPLDPRVALRLDRSEYVAWFRAQPASLQSAMREAWGEPVTNGPTNAPVRWVSSEKALRGSLLPDRHEPHSTDEHYLFSGLDLGNVFVGLQPPRGFGVDPEAVYHAPDLPPAHHYAAFYRWLASRWKADAIIHYGKHGTLEWLPGKSVALSSACAPDALLGELPLFYPFVVNDPGEGAQAKRRAHAVIIDHLVPPLTHADTYGPLATLSRLIEEYYRAESLDPSKLPLLQSQIWELVRQARLDDDLRQLRRQRHGNHVHEWDERPNEEGVPRSLEKLSGRGMAHLLEDLDAYLCDLGRAQVRNGLHVFGQAPEGEGIVDLLFAIVRCPNGGIPALGPSLIKACGLDPIAVRDATGVWKTDLPTALAHRLPDVPTASEVRVGLDDLGRELLRALAKNAFSAQTITATMEACLGLFVDPNDDLFRLLQFLCTDVVPNLARSTDETKNLLAALDGRFVPAGPSGAPSRGMAHVLPTGRNFYTVDPRGLPSAVSWTVGQALARDAVNHFLEETGAYPENIALSVWGTATMRTGGDDIAQALALIGARPTWHNETRRTAGVEAIPLVELGRPRIDVTLRVSGFFRDAFPQLMQLVDDAVRLIASLDEPLEQNFLRKHWLAETARLVGEGLATATAEERASYRVFSSKPGAYGTGLLELIENRAWRDADDLARAYLTWGGWAYSAQAPEGVEAGDAFRHRLSQVDLALHNQDNREHDLFDSDDYFQFHGGLVATVAALAGRKPRAYFGDSSDPSRPGVRTLQGEALRVYRSRVVNPKWVSAIQRHGYKGGLEMAATVDYLFGFSATADVVTDWMFEGVAEQYTHGEARSFLQRSNPWALHAIAERLLEAADRKLWDASAESLAHLRATFLETETGLEAATETRP